MLVASWDACRHRSPCFREQATLTAVGAELSGVKASGLQHHRELVDGTPALWVLLECRHHLSVQTQGLPTFVEGDHMDARLLEDPSHALQVGRAHPPLHVKLDRLAVTAHRIAPSSPLAEMNWSGEASTFLAEGDAEVAMRDGFNQVLQINNFAPVRSSTANH